MKKGYIMAAVVLMAAVCGQASAQQFRFGVEAGGTVSKSTWELAEGHKSKSVGGYTIGITAEYEFFDNVWLQSGLTFGTKGAKSEAKGLSASWSTSGNLVKYDETITYRPFYVQIPVNVAYKFVITPRVSLFVSGGGFLSQGLSGEYNRKATYYSNDEDTNKNGNAFSMKALKRFDCGLNLGGGVEFGRLILRVGYDWSMLNIVKDAEVLGADDFKNRSLAIAAGLKF